MKIPPHIFYGNLYLENVEQLNLNTLEPQGKLTLNHIQVQHHDMCLNKSIGRCEPGRKLI